MTNLTNEPPRADTPQAEAILLESAAINAATQLRLYAIPFCYEVRINDELVYPFMSYGNARDVFKAVLRDLK